MKLSCGGAYVIMQIFSKIKYLVEAVFNINLLSLKSDNTPKTVLILTPQYLNYGDHAIAVAERNLLKNFFPDRKLLDINYSFYSYWPEKTKQLINKDDIIVITGGGYMGDLWPELQDSVNSIFENFKENKIIIAPQTIFYNDLNSKDFVRFKQLLLNHKDLHVLARENNTFNIVTEKFELPPVSKCSCFPDMVLFLNAGKLIKHKNRRKGIGLCLRDDQEKTLDKNELSILNNEISAFNDKIYYMKMAYGHVEFPTWMSTILVKQKLKQYAEKKFIITDRLHGMVFAAITGTPCIVFDNVSKKVSGVYEWIKELDYIFIINDTTELSTALNQIKNIDYSLCNKQIIDLQKKLKHKYSNWNTLFNN